MNRATHLPHVRNGDVLACVIGGYDARKCIIADHNHLCIAVVHRRRTRRRHGAIRRRMTTCVCAVMIVSVIIHSSPPASHQYVSCFWPLSPLTDNSMSTGCLLRSSVRAQSTVFERG